VQELLHLQPLEMRVPCSTWQPSGSVLATTVVCLLKYLKE
jgi:hypothetical protein